MLGSIYFPQARYHKEKIFSASLERSEVPTQVLTRSSSALEEVACGRGAMSSGKPRRSWAPQQQARDPCCSEISRHGPWPGAAPRDSSGLHARKWAHSLIPEPCYGSCPQRRKREGCELAFLLLAISSCLVAARRCLQVKEAEPSCIIDLFPGRRCNFYSIRGHSVLLWKISIYIGRVKPIRSIRY